VGDKSFHSIPLLRFLADKNWVVYTVNYRLSPKVAFPSHLIDCKRALAWIRQTGAAKYGGNPAEIVVGGESAGGHLAVLMALTGNLPEYQPGFESVNTKISACLDLYGVHDFTDHHGHFVKMGTGFQDLLQFMVIQKNFPRHLEDFKKASPFHLLANLKSADIPPIMSVHGDRDCLVPVNDSVSFHEALKKKRDEAGESGKDVLIK